MAAGLPVCSTAQRDRLQPEMIRSVVMRQLFAQDELEGRMGERGQLMASSYPSRTSLPLRRKPSGKRWLLYQTHCESCIIPCSRYVSCKTACAKPEILCLVIEQRIQLKLIVYRQVHATNSVTDLRCLYLASQDYSVFLLEIMCGHF